MVVRYDWFNRPDRLPKNLGKSLFLVGTATSGPSETPVKCESVEEARTTFGENSVLAKGFEQAFSSYPNLDYYLVRTGGVYANASLVGINKEGEVKRGLILRAKYAGAAYEAINIRMDYIDVGQGPEWCILINYEDQTVCYPLADYPVINLLVRDINEHCEQGITPVYAASEMGECSPTALIGFNAEVVNLAGGVDGPSSSRNELYKAMEYTLSILEGQGIDGLVLLGVYFDDVYDPYYYGKGEYGQAFYTGPEDMLTLAKASDPDYRLTFHELLIDFCRSQHQVGLMTHGFLGFRPAADPETYAKMDYISWLVESSCLASGHGLRDMAGIETIDKGFYISLVIGDLLFRQGGPAQYWDNAAAVYAALYLTAEFETTTNIKLKNFSTTHLMIDGPDLAKLANVGVVGFRYSPLARCLSVTAGVTPALATSDLRQDVNVKIMQEAINRVNLAIQNVVGENANLPITPKLLNEGIEEKLEGLKEEGLLPDYEFLLTLSSSNKWSLSLDLVPKNAIGQINVPIAFALGGD